MMGKLIYPSHTRPDITYVVSVVGQFMHARLKSHLQVVYKIVKYLKANLSKGLMFQRKGEAYTVDRRLTTRYYASLGGDLIT